MKIINMCLLIGCCVSSLSCTKQDELIEPYMKRAYMMLTAQELAITSATHRSMRTVCKPLIDTVHTEKQALIDYIEVYAAWLSRMYELNPEPGSDEYIEATTKRDTEATVIQSRIQEFRSRYWDVLNMPLNIRPFVTLDPRDNRILWLCDFVGYLLVFNQDRTKIMGLVNPDDNLAYLLPIELAVPRNTLCNLYFSYYLNRAGWFDLPFIYKFGKVARIPEEYLQEVQGMEDIQGLTTIRMSIQ